MIDCSKEIGKFYDLHVRLSSEEQGKLAGYRDTNITRVKKGLEANEKPNPTDYINQGSYAMDTIIQHPENDYDLDIGLLFKKIDLVDSNGVDYSAKNAREMVCEAVQDKRFNKAPEARLNCVRIYYNEGYHIDMPIYREIIDQTNNSKIEIASSDWIETDPKAVTNWFCDSVSNKSPDVSNGKQMRRIVRLIKYWAQSKLSKKPSGFIISKLVDECYKAVSDRDDEALYKTLDSIYTRLILSKDVFHPILAGILISEGKETAMNTMFDKLEPALESLSKLNDLECTKQSALKIWRKFFGHDYFDTLIEENSNSKSLVANAIPTAPIIKQGGDRFA